MITKDMLIIDALQQGDPDKLANVLQESGMHCLHCMLAHGETIEEAAAVHGIDADELVKKLLEALQKIMEENVHTYMPGFTHLQKAQPVTLAHHVGAYFEMFVRDRSRLADIRKRTVSYTHLTLPTNPRV